MKANIVIEKSFDVTNEFTKVWEQGDFLDFLIDEGVYLDKLARVLEEKGNEKDSFTVTYTISLTK